MRSPAIMMPFVAKRVFDHEPVEITQAWGLRDLQPGMAYTLCNTLECEDCGVLFLDYRFSDHEMSLLYKDYRGDEYNALRARFEPAYNATALHYEGRAAYVEDVERILAPYLPARPRVLDWGGDSGVNSPFRFSAALLHVYDISGVETCAEATPVTPEVCLQQHYDLVNCSQVLEHVPHPANLLRQIADTLRKETILYLEVPLEEIFRSGGNGSPRFAMKRHWHEHINFFSPSSLQSLARTCGLEVIAEHALPVALGWKNAEVQILICKKHEC
jgi:SAM-dependent methyltransferase